MYAQSDRQVRAGSVGGSVIPHKKRNAVKHLSVRIAMKVLWHNIFCDCVPEWEPPYTRLDHELQTYMWDALIDFVNGYGTLVPLPDEDPADFGCLRFPWIEFPKYQQHTLS